MSDHNILVDLDLFSKNDNGYFVAYLNEVYGLAEI